MPGLILAWVLSLASLAANAHPVPRGMAWVQPGEFIPFFKESLKKGEPGEPRAVPIQVAGFWMDTRPVMLSEFLEFVLRHSEWRKSKAKGLLVDSSYLKNWENDLRPDKRLGSKIPVTYVSWFAAQAYCQSKSKELPTIAQWERAAGALPAADSTALDWYARPSSAPLARVGQTPKNSYGIQDLIGLVWEWVSDFNSVLLAADDRAQGVDESGQFCGSGAANSRDPKDYAAFMRYGFRNSLRGNYAIGNLGFRCVSGGRPQ